MIHKKFRILISLLLISTITAIACLLIAQKGDNEQNLLHKFSSYAEKAQKEWGIPGMAIAIVKDNRIIYAKGFGTRNSIGAPITPNTIFGVGSCTKSFTTALLAKLIDQGKFNWDTKIIKLYPKFKLYDPKVTKEFAVRDLITHDSGLPPDSLQLQAYLGYSQDHIIRSLRFVKPINKFRTKFAYQNSLALVALKIIEKYSEESYGKFLHSTLLIPLHMNNSFVSTELPKGYNNIALPNWYFFGKIIAIPAKWPYFSWNPIIWEKANLPSGGLKSTANDLAKWIIFQLNNGEANGKQLISKKSMEFMHSPLTIIAKQKDGAIKYAYGEGWYYDAYSYKPYTMIWHSGEINGWISQMAYLPKMHVGIVILINVANSVEMPYYLSRKFFDLYLGYKPKDWVKMNFIKRKAMDRKKLETIEAQTKKCNMAPRNDLSKYTGIYYNNAYGKVLVKKSGDKLNITIGPHNTKWILTPCLPGTFKLTWPHMPYPGPDLIRFTKNHEMQIELLNGDGCGTFK